MGIERNGTGRIGSSARLVGKPQKPPGDDGVNTQATLQAVGSAQLTVFEAAAALEHEMIAFDELTQSIPTDVALGIGNLVDRLIGQQQWRSDDWLCGY